MHELIQCYVMEITANCKYKRANLPCSPLCNCKYKNTIGITNGLATSNALINKRSVRNIIKDVLCIEIKVGGHFVLGACPTGLLG